MSQSNNDHARDPVEEYAKENQILSSDGLYALGERINTEMDSCSDFENFPYDIFESGSNDREGLLAYLTRNRFNKNLRGEDVKPNHRIIVKSIILEYNLFVLQGDVYLYNESDGTYHRDEEGKRTKRIIVSYLGDRFSEIKTIDAIYKLLCIQLSIQKNDREINKRPKGWIHFINGYLDLDELDDLIPHDPEYFSTCVIPHSYDPEKYPPTHRIVHHHGKNEEIPLIFDEIFNAETLGGEDNLKMLLQYIGYSMTLDTRHQKFLMLVGSGGTGKSTLLSLIEKIIGRENVSHVSLQGLQERFTKSSLYLKQANICADIPMGASKEIDDLKKLTGEDVIYADRKNQTPLEFISFARLFFSANAIPLNSSDQSDAFFRRLLILEMNQKPIEIDPYLGEKLEMEIPNIITKAVTAYYLSDGKIEESKRSKELVTVARKKNDSVEAFIEDMCVIGKEFRIPRTRLFDEFKLYCRNERRRVLSSTEFYTSLENKGFHITPGGNRNVCGLKRNSIIQLDSRLSEVDLK